MSERISKSKLEQAQRLEAELSRELSQRAQLFQEAMAGRLGLSAADYRCLELAQHAGREGVVTAGRLAELTGLTTGAVTGVLDRLERAGFVRREKDLQDRRQVLVRFVKEREREIETIHASYEQAWLTLCARYTEEQLAVIQRFSREVIALIDAETKRLHEGSSLSMSLPDPELAELSASLDAITEARLEVTRGAANLTIRSGQPELLYRLRGQGNLPKVKARAGVVSLEQGRSGFKLFDLKKRFLDLELSPGVPWAISLRGGASHVRAHWRELELRSLEISGGMSDVSIELPAPRASVSVRLTGGAQQLRILRPKGTAARLVVGSGVSGLTIDSLKLGSVGGETRWETPDFEKAQGRYDIELSGGANELLLGVY